MHPILFSIGKINIYTHGIAFVLGAVVGGGVIYYLAKTRGLNTRYLFNNLIYCLFFGIVGARITYAFFYHDQFANFYQVLFFWNGGLVSFGGILFGFLTAWFLLKIENQDVGKWFDAAIIGFLLGLSIGRIGCLLTGDILGLRSTSKIAIFNQIPVSLFEAIWSFVIAGGLFYLYKYQENFLKHFRDGFVFWSGLGLYFLGRFFIDFWRESEIIWLKMNSGQIVSLACLLISALVIFRFYLKKGEDNA